MKRIFAFLTAAIVLAVGMPFWQARPSAATEKLVAITFDDGPGGNTGTLLDGLKSRGAYATFFCTGTMAAARPEMLKRIVKEGHQLANHTQNHKQLTTLTKTQIQNEINSTRKYLVQAGGEKTYYIRPPYGSYNATVQQAAGAPLILWSVDTLDWKYRNADTVYNNIMKQTKDGSIILLHDLYSTSVQGALRAVTALQKQGYEFVTVEQLFRRRGITPQNGKVYSSVPGSGKSVAAPVITVKEVWGGKQVTLKASSGTVYYTTVGTAPTGNSKKYSAPFVLKQNAKVQAIAVDGGVSKTAEKTVTVAPAPFPLLSEKNGKITITTSSVDVKIYYTTDGSAPTVQSKAYSGAFSAGKAVGILVRGVGKADRTVRYDKTEYGDWFYDVPSFKWYYKAVGEIVHRGILTGVDVCCFAPDERMTRAMFVTALARMAGADGKTGGGVSFSDVPKNTWYSAAVSWACEKGIVKGVSQHAFAPEQCITREQMCVMLYRYAQAYGYQPEERPVSAFADQKQVSSWAAEAVNRLHSAGVIDGMGGGNFVPQGKATRAQCAKLLLEFLHKTGR